MAFDWFRLDRSFIHHPKTVRLATKLEQPLAGMYVVRLWSWFSHFAARGVFQNHDVDAVEQWCGWSGDSGILVATLVDVGWLEAREGGFEAHDWWEKQGALVEKSKRDAEFKRKKRRDDGALAERAAPRPPARAVVKPARRRRADGTGRDVDVLPLNPLQAETLKTAWNETAAKAGATGWDETSPGRAKAVAAALARRPLEQWLRVFAGIAADEFATGRRPGADGKFWRADIDYALRPEGKKPEPAVRYLERSTAPPGPAHVPLEHRPSRNLG